MLKEDKVKVAKNVFHKLNERLKSLNRSKDSMESAQNQLKTQRKTIESKIRKKSYEALSRINKRRDKMLKDLEDLYLPKSKGLTIEINKIAARCKIIKQALQYAECMSKGMSVDVVLSVVELIKRLENLAEDDDGKFKIAGINTEMSNITLKVTKPLELLLGSAERFWKEMERKCGSPQDDNSSDFICSFADKSTQTSEVDFKTCHG